MICYWIIYFILKLIINEKFINNDIDIIIDINIDSYSFITVQ